MVSAGPCEHPPRSWSLICPEGVTAGSFALLFTYLFVYLTLWKGELGEAWNPNQQPQVREVASCRCHLRVSGEAPPNGHALSCAPSAV